MLLPRELRVKRAAGTGQRFRVEWKEEREWETAAGSDLLRVGVLYDGLPLGARMAVEVSGRRGDLCGEFTLSEEEWAEGGAHVYCFFAREDGSAFSDSQYFRIEDGDARP